MGYREMGRVGGIMMLEGERVVDGIKGVTKLGLWVDRVAFFLVMWDGESGLEGIYVYLKVGLAFLLQSFLCR
jgi:hypothetical protein